MSHHDIVVGDCIICKKPIVTKAEEPTNHVYLLDKGYAHLHHPGVKEEFAVTNKPVE